MITVKELAQEITRELSELYLRIEGDDYRQLYVERNVNLEAISELEKQLAEAKDRIVELEVYIERLIRAGNALDVPPDDFSEEQKDWRETISEWLQGEI